MVILRPALSLQAAESPADGKGRYRGMIVGMNTSWNTDWVPDFPFADGVHDMRRWGKAHFQAGNAEVDAEGWPVLRPGKKAYGLMFWSIGPTYPAGEYVLTWQGSGDVSLSGQASSVGLRAVSSQPGRKVVRVTPGNQGFHLVVQQGPGQRVTDIHCWLPGQEGRMFHADYVAAMNRFGIIRFMNWGRVNSSEVVTWADRRLPEEPIQIGRPGVAYEYMAWLANTCQSDPWVCVPHLADDDHIRRMAKLFLEELDPGRKIYVEFSNELWNTAPAFKQGQWAWSGPETARVKAGRAIANNHKIWHEVWSQAGQRERLVLCVMGQAGSGYVSRQFVYGTEEYGGPFDAIGCAGYFGSSGKTKGKLLEGMLKNAKSFPQSNLDVEEVKQLADQFDVPFLVYECGHHVEAPRQTTAEVLKQAMRDDQMEEVYRAALDRYAEYGCDAVVFFDYANRIDERAFGHVEYQGQPLSEAPKMRAIVEALNEN